VIIGIGAAAMHHLGMAAMSMQDSMSYNVPLLMVSVLIAVVAGTAALWAGTRVNSLAATTGAALIMGVGVSGMHYTGMAALHIGRGPALAVASATGMSAVSGTTAAVFLIPLLLVISIATFAVTLTITMAPGEEEIAADAEMRRRMEYLQRRRDWTQVPTGPTGPAEDWYESLSDDRF
jgi:NO-binding membrane sensor protein with MHYT domain